MLENLVCSIILSIIKVYFKIDKEVLMGTLGYTILTVAFSLGMIVLFASLIF